MKEALTALLQTIIVAAIPVLTAYIGKWLNAKAAQVANNIENDKAKAYAKETSDAVKTAVTYVSQTYVDALRKSDSFTAENQKEALNLALSEANRLLSVSATEFLTHAYGDVMAYLVAKIEQEVRTQKIDSLAINGGINGSK